MEEDEDYVPSEEHGDEEMDEDALLDDDMEDDYDDETAFLTAGRAQRQSADEGELNTVLSMYSGCCSQLITQAAMLNSTRNGCSGLDRQPLCKRGRRGIPGHLFDELPDPVSRLGLSRQLEQGLTCIDGSSGRW